MNEQFESPDHIKAVETYDAKFISVNVMSKNLLLRSSRMIVWIGKSRVICSELAKVALG